MIGAQRKDLKSGNLKNLILGVAFCNKMYYNIIELGKRRTKNMPDITITLNKYESIQFNQLNTQSVSSIFNVEDKRITINL